MSIFTNLNYARNVNYVNNELNRDESYSTSGGFGFLKYINAKYNLRLYTNITYFSDRNTVNPTIFTHYWSQSHFLECSVYPFHGLEISTKARYNWQEKTDLFGKNISVLLWNTAVSQNFIKNQLTLRLSVNNLLNQQSGVTRTNLGNMNTQSTTNVIGRYWMLCVVLRFERQRKIN
jgi:hypothetical protein